MRIVGIDPAPKKGATLYDPTSDDNGGWSTIDACKLPDHVRLMAEADSELLISWDAPLTAGVAGKDGCYYERPIERFFQTNRDWRAPKGISVRAYAGCPHWAITRAAVGLPRVGRFDADDLPFTLCAEGRAPIATGGKLIVEVHPAVAIWLWCKPNDLGRTNWAYKKDKAVSVDLWRAIEAIAGQLKPPRAPQDDDEFDAYVAYLLGTKWICEDGVILLGNQGTGSFLVPALGSLPSAFQEWSGQRDS